MIYIITYSVYIIMFELKKYDAVGINYKCYKYSISIFIITEYIILLYIKDIGNNINCFILLLLIDD